MCRGHSDAGALWVQKPWWASEDGSEEWVGVGTEARGILGRPCIAWLVPGCACLLPL